VVAKGTSGDVEIVKKHEQATRHAATEVVERRDWVVILHRVIRSASRVT